MPTPEDSSNRFKATIYHALSDPIRLEIINYLRNGERCVCEIVPHLGLIQPLISRHLKTLKDAGILQCRKDGTKRFYSIVDMQIFKIIDALTPELTSALMKEAFQSVTDT